MQFFTSSAYNPGLAKPSVPPRFAPSANFPASIFLRRKRKQRTKLVGTAQNAGMFIMGTHNIITLYESKSCKFLSKTLISPNSIAGPITRRQSFRENTGVFVGNKRIQKMTLGWHRTLVEKSVVGLCLASVAMSVYCCVILGRVLRVLSYCSFGMLNLKVLAWYHGDDNVTDVSLTVPVIWIPPYAVAYRCMQLQDSYLS